MESIIIVNPSETLYYLYIEIMTGFIKQSCGGELLKNKDTKILIGLSRNLHALHRQTAQLLLQHNLTLSQFGVLEVLFSKGELRIGEVQDKILSSTGTMPTILKNLERQQYIQKIPDTQDKRATKLQLLPKGQELVETILPENLKQIERYCLRLTENEKVELIHLLKKLGGK